MAYTYHPFLNSFALAQEARIPIWALIEHAAASGMREPPRQVSSPQGRRAGGPRQGSKTARPQEQKICSSRQSQQQQVAAQNESQGLSFQDFIANAAAIAQTILGEQQQSEQTLSSAVAGQSGQVLAVTNSRDTGFEVKLDVSNFNPEELNVKTVENSIVIEGTHEREDAHGFVARSFKRRFTLPEEVKAENVTCKLATNGVLILSAPIAIPTTERSIPINFTGVPASVPIPEAPIAEEVPLTTQQEVKSEEAPASDDKEEAMSVDRDEAKLG